MESKRGRESESERPKAARGASATPPCGRAPCEQRLDARLQLRGAELVDVAAVILELLLERRERKLPREVAGERGVRLVQPLELREAEDGEVAVGRLCALGTSERERGVACASVSSRGRARVARATRRTASMETLRVPPEKSAISPMISPTPRGAAMRASPTTGTSAPLSTTPKNVAGSPWKSTVSRSLKWRTVSSLERVICSIKSKFVK